MSDSMLEDITADIIRQYPNTYTFTKAIAERLLLDERGHVPAVIFRPSIVTASLKEPISVSGFAFSFLFGVSIVRWATSMAKSSKPSVCLFVCLSRLFPDVNYMSH